MLRSCVLNVSQARDEAVCVFTCTRDRTYTNIHMRLHLCILKCACTFVCVPHACINVQVSLFVGLFFFSHACVHGWGAIRSPSRVRIYVRIHAYICTTLGVGEVNLILLCRGTHGHVETHICALMT